MTTHRLRELMRMARKVGPAKVHGLYMELYGADFRGGVSVARARESIREACHELLEKQVKTKRLTPSEIRRRHVERALRGHRC